MIARQPAITRLTMAVIATVIATLPISQLRGQETQLLTAAQLFRVASPAIVRVVKLAESGQQLGQGTGFFISDDGLLITNHHVVRDGASWRIVLEDDRVLNVQGILAQDPGADLAVLQVDGHWLPSLSLGPSEYPTPGEKVVAIGNPLGLTNTISDGLLSGYRIRGNQPRMMQISAPISRGSSGGPLFLDGRPLVIGVTSSGVEGGQNLNFAIPVREVNRLVRGLTRPDSAPAGPQELELIKLAAQGDAQQVQRLMKVHAGHDQLADQTIGGQDETTYKRIELDRSLLVVGENVLAVEVHQASRNSSDLGFDLQLASQGAAAAVLVAKGAKWKYLDDGSDQGVAWREPGFDDSQWKEGAAPLGYGDEHIVTTISSGNEADQKHVTTYFRHRFPVDEPSAVKRLMIELLRDDSAVVYLNGRYAGHDNITFARDINKTDEQGRAVLHAAAAGGHEQIVAALLEAGAVVNQRTTSGQTALDLAEQAGHAQVAGFLRQHGAVPSTQLEQVDQLLAAAREGSAERVTEMIGGGLNANVANAGGATALHYATFQGHAAVVGKLLELGADAGRADHAGYVPLHLAALTGQREIAERLIAAGADVSRANKLGDTLLMEAARAGHVELVRILVEHGAPLDARSPAGRTALHYSVRRPQVAELLIERGADLDAADRQGSTTLMLALQQKAEDTADLLRAKGATEPPKPVETPLTSNFAGDLTNSLGMALKKVEPGQFVMGSASDEQGRDDHETQHTVTLTKPFLLGVTEVTRDQFAQFIKDSGHKPFSQPARAVIRRGNQTIIQQIQVSWSFAGLPQGNNHPVVMVNWDDAQAFCQWLSTKENKRYRLPTEAEWEYACRAGSTTRYQSGSELDDLKKVGWCNYDGGRATGRSTKPVGSYEPNAWGLYDMHGNVHEWVADWFGPLTDAAASDPQGPESGEQRVRRSGSWSSDPNSCRSAYRNQQPPNRGSNNLGFRVLLEVD